MTLAYLDPASGSLIASALVGGVAAAGVAAKQARARLSGGFGRKRKQESELSVDTTENEVVEGVTDVTAADSAPADATAADSAPADAKSETVSSASES